MIKNRPLRICMVTTFYPPYHFGGDAVFVYRLAEALAGRGHKVDVVHSADAYHLRHPAEPELAFDHHPNVTVHSLRSKSPMLASLASHQFGQPAVFSRRIRQILDEGNFDVIHYHNISLMGGPGVLRYGRAVKLYTTHEYWLICPTHVLFTFDREACVERKCLLCTLHSRRPPQLWRYTGLIERCLRAVDSLLIPSRFAMDQFRAQGLKCPMHLLPNFVPVPGAEHEAAPHPNGGRPYFLFVGRLEKLKGVQDILPLFAREPGASLLIVGDGDYAPVLKEQARGMDHVKFLGAIHPSEVGNLYRHAIASLAPSLCYEVFPLISSEAFAHGTPVIARRIGALEEVLEESGGGFLFNSMDECRLAMERLRTEPELRDAMGERGRATLLNNWSVDKHLERYLEIARTLLAERAGAGISG